MTIQLPPRTVFEAVFPQFCLPPSPCWSLRSSSFASLARAYVSCAVPRKKVKRNKPRRNTRATAEDALAKEGTRVVVSTLARRAVTTVTATTILTTAAVVTSSVHTTAWRSYKVPCRPANRWVIRRDIRTMKQPLRVVEPRVFRLLNRINTDSNRIVCISDKKKNKKNSMYV